MSDNKPLFEVIPATMAEKDLQAAYLAEKILNSMDRDELIKTFSEQFSAALREGKI